MPILIEKIIDKLRLESLKKDIDEGNMEYLFFPKKINIKKLTSKNDKKDYIIKAIQKGYKITKGSPDYIKKDKRYLNYYINELRKKIAHDNYSDLYDVYDEVLMNLNTDKDFILKAIDNGYDISKEEKRFIMSNKNYIKYYIKKSKNIEILDSSSVTTETIKQIVNDDPDLITQYIDYALKNNQDAFFIGKLDLNYIKYYINNAEKIKEAIHSISDEKWRELKKENPEIIELAIKKCSNIDYYVPKFIREEYKEEYLNQITQNIINNEYETLWDLDEDELYELAKNPNNVIRLIEAGYYEIINYTENNIENTKLYLEKILEKNNTLLNYINEITHKNYKNYGEFIYINEHIRKVLYDIKKQEGYVTICNEDAVPDIEEYEYEVDTVKEKLMELLKVTRISGMNLDYEALSDISEGLIPKFKSKIYEEIFLKEKNIFNIDRATKKTVFEVISIFGLFEEDKINVNIRLNKLKELINRLPNKITEEEYEKLLETYNDKKELIEKAFKQVIGKKYKKNDNNLIPPSLEFYKKYFAEELTEKKYSILKKLLPDGTIGSELNKYLKRAYDEKECMQYELNNLKKEEQAEIRAMIQNIDIEGVLTKHSIHRIFSGFDQEYKDDFYEFFIKNIDLILNDENNQSSIKTIHRNFWRIKEESSTPEPTYAKTIEFISRTNFGANVSKEFEEQLKKAGVTSLEAAEYYYALHNKALKITSTALPNYIKEYEEIIEDKKVKFRARRLEKKDPLLVLVGEKDYTNCCQIYKSAGEKCNKYSALSQYSGVFVTEVLLDDKWTLLTQSWDWVNSEVYCHDNIEGTDTLKSSKEFKNIVIKMLKEHAENIIETSKKDIEKYIEENAITDEATIEQLKNQIIKVVTVGTKYNDINIENYFTQAIKNTKYPINYHGYRDSEDQLIISGYETKTEKKYSMNQICIYKENSAIKNSKVMSLTQEEENLINKIVEQDIKETYKEDTQIIFTDNWVIIYTIDEEGITIENIKATDNNLKELSETLRKLKKIYPNITINPQSNLQSYTETIENMNENDEKTR